MQALKKYHHAFQILDDCQSHLHLNLLSIFEYHNIPVLKLDIGKHNVRFWL